MNDENRNRWEAWKPVSTIMRRDVPKVSSYCSGAALESIFAGLSCPMALVVDDAGRAFAIVHRDQLGSGNHVAAASVPVAFSLNESIPISLAAALMASAGVHEVPVLSAAQDAVGVLTSNDILLWVAR